MWWSLKEAFSRELWSSDENSVDLKAGPDFKLQKGVNDRYGMFKTPFSMFVLESPKVSDIFWMNCDSFTKVETIGFIHKLNGITFFSYHVGEYTIRSRWDMVWCHFKNNICIQERNCGGSVLWQGLILKNSFVFSVWNICSHFCGGFM